MVNPEINKIMWLIKDEDNDLITLGFLRDHRGGVYIIGGTTGSHYTGHGEKWETKWKEYVDSGYIYFEKAKEKNILNKDWTPPELNEEDQKLIGKIKENLL